MSYLTAYDLTVGPFPPEFSGKDRERLKQELDELCVFEDVFVAADYCSADAWTKWYEWNEDMQRISARFPSILFTLKGAGEDSDDRWYAYYLGGRVQHAPARIEYDSFDPAKLEPRKVDGTG